MNIKTGDDVRFVFLSYQDLLRSDYDQSYSLSNKIDGESILSLGGIYKVKDIQRNKWGVNMYRLLDTNDYYIDWQPERNIEPVDNKLVCPFTISQILTFKPKSSKVDIEAIFFFTEEVEKCNKFILNGVLNNYYVFMKTIEERVFHFPFLWYDFELVDGMQRYQTPSEMNL
jgi:hypothetical protein